MTKADKQDKQRRIHAIPEGVWIFAGDDKLLFKASNSKDFNSECMRLWSHCSDGQGFGLSDLREIYKAPLTPKGMKRVADAYGPWDLRVDGGEVEFRSWRWLAMDIKRAYSLHIMLKEGREFEWEVFSKGTIPYLRLLSWPEKLRCAKEREPHSLFIGGSISRGEADFEDPLTARRYAKRLLAQMLNRGLKHVELDFGYSKKTDSFVYDAGHSETISLAAACWLTLRDLAAGLEGLRFCAACRKRLPPEAKSNARVCPGSRRCQQADYRARKAASNG